MKLNVGCGKRLKHDYINIDLSEPADLILDVRNGFPYPDNSCEIIYCEHFLEHLIYPDESVPFLQECHRVLNRELHIGVPDTRQTIDDCLNDFEKFKAQTIAHHWYYPKFCETPLEYLNWHFRMGGDHKFAFDLETLISQLERVEFVATQREFSHELDTRSRRFGTIYVVATK